MRNKSHGIISLALLFALVLSTLLFTVSCTEVTEDGIEVPKGEGSIIYLGCTEFLKVKPSHAKAGNEVTFKAEIPMEGRLVAFMGNEEIMPQGLDNSNFIIYTFTMPEGNVRIELNIAA